MTFQHSYLGFLYRQFIITPAPLPSNLSLNGQTGIVTGSNTGLGYQACKQLLERGLPHLILAVRSTSKGQEARTKLLASLPLSSKTPLIEVWLLDLSSYASIIAFTQRIKNDKDLYIDFAILNAGVANFEYEINSSTGNEVVIQTNWLSTALLTILLRPVLQSKFEVAKPTKSPVISIIGSETAGWAKFKEEKYAEKNKKSILTSLNEKSNYDAEDRYYTSKLLLMLFFVEFCDQVSAPGSEMGDGTRKVENDVVVNYVNPGFCYGTELHRTVPGVAGMVFGIMKRIIGKSTQVGARNLSHGAVVAGRESHGKFLIDERSVQFVPYVKSEKGRVMRKRIWEELNDEMGKVVDFGRAMEGEL